jgi:DNA-binding protein HU-beta
MTSFRPNLRKQIIFCQNGRKNANLADFMACLWYIWLRQFSYFVDFLEVLDHMATSTATGKKRMTQSDVINYFAERTEMKRAQVKQLFEDLANLATSEVKSNGEFVLPGFGKLVRSERKAREGRNPATGETIQIPAKTTLKFRVGKAMKDSVLPRK